MTRHPDRLARLLKHRRTDGIAIEVAPYFNPALPKADGNDVLILDVFDTATLRKYAQKDPNIPDSRIVEIEDVDLVGDASRIGEIIAAQGLAGKVGYIVSSHNFEHLPNPISFLRGVEACLMPGGVLSMAIPDCRATFDHCRSLTRLVDWLVAYHDGRTQPDANMLFDLHANTVRFARDTGGGQTCDWRTADPRDVRFDADLRGAYSDWLAARAQPTEYKDTHVSVVFDASFALLIEDLRFLGLIGLETIEISQNNGHEFYVHLRRPLTAPGTMSAADYAPMRDALMRQAMAGQGAFAFPLMRHGFVLSLKPKTLIRKLVGGDRYYRIRAWNRERLARKRRLK